MCVCVYLVLYMCRYRHYLAIYQTMSVCLSVCLYLSIYLSTLVCSLSIYLSIFHFVSLCCSYILSHAERQPWPCKMLAFSQWKECSHTWNSFPKYKISGVTHASLNFPPFPSSFNPLLTLFLFLVVVVLLLRSFIRLFVLLSYSLHFS